MQTCPACARENLDDARFCLACGAALAAPAGREVRKVVTVLFADVVGSTALGETSDPEAVRRTMSRWFDEARIVLERHGGTVEKFVGDAVMAVFGVPQAFEDDALRAVRAAVELRAAVRRSGLEARIGVNTGEVVAGTSGHTLVTGDAVNVAARLEQAADPDAILLGTATERLVRDAVEVERVEPLRLKGKTTPVEAHALLAVRAGAAGRTRRLDAPLVGRTRELARLRAAFDDAVRSSSCHLFTLLGPAGAGKSRLAEELVRSIGAGATTMRGRCHSYGEGITFTPVVEAVPGAAAVVERELPAAETFAAVRKLVEGRARKHAVLLVFDDVHWGAPTFLDLVEHVAEWSRNSPILLLCLARPELLEERPGWGGGKLNATTLLLEPLDESEALRLVATVADLGDGDARRVVAAAEGNPLFVEEMAALVAEGELLAAPPSIQALLQARIDRLTEDERLVLEAAAVEGKDFHAGAVAHLVGEHVPAGTAGELLSLVRKDLVRPVFDRRNGDDGEAFRFRHQLIRDVAYSTLAKESRAALHESLAGWLARRASAAPDLDELLGHHLEQAHLYRLELGGDPAAAVAERAGRHLARAGRRALVRGDTPAAVSLLRRAAALLPTDDAERVDLLPRLGLALMQSGADFVDADAVLAEAIRLAVQRGDAGVEARAVAARIWIEVNTPPGLDERANERMVVQARQALGVLEAAADHEGAVLAWRMIGEYHNSRGEGHEWVAALEESLREARLTGARGEIGPAAYYLMGAMLFGPTPASEVAARAETLLAELEAGSLAEAAAVRGLAGARAFGGQLDEARALLARARAILEDLGLSWWLTGISFVAPYVELFAGDYAAAELALQHGIDVYASVGETGRLSTLLAIRAQALALQGKYLEALDESARSRAVSAAVDSASQIGWRVGEARALAGLGRTDEAVALTREAVEIGAASSFLLHHASAALALGEVLAAAGRRDEAREALGEAVRLFELKEVVPGAAQARAALVDL